MDRGALIATLRREGITDEAVLAAMIAVPREQFVDGVYLAKAWENHPLPIGAGQTISQPLVVAAMTAALGVGPGDVVLDVGTGSGYQAAVLAELGCRVWGIEWVPELAARASAVLTDVGLDVDVVVGTAGSGFRNARRSTRSWWRQRARRCRLRCSINFGARRSEGP